MKTVKVKICGITREEDLRMVCDMGVDAVGFVVNVPSSPRNLSVETAKKLIGIVPVSVKSVLVTVPRSVNEVVTLYKKLMPNVVQIHGDNILHISALREKLPNTMLIRAITVNPKRVFDASVKESEFFDAILLDSYSRGKHGGTGVTHNWILSRSVREAIHPKPLILAGGLNPENVKDAIRIVKPYAVDVSTGVETAPGIKDPNKVEAFIKNAKEIKLDDG
ncbi:MAG: phosphoribosylanthranilate isomerase [Candidatus Bathyarchaeia archaeon]